MKNQLCGYCCRYGGRMPFQYNKLLGVPMQLNNQATRASLVDGSRSELGEMAVSIAGCCLALNATDSVRRQTRVISFVS